MRFSISFVISCAFIAFIGHSIYNLVSLYRPPVCVAGEVCYASYLNTKPNLELFVYLSDGSRSTDYELALHESNFDYSKPFEKEISIELRRAVRNNGSLFLHAVVAPQRRRHARAPILQDAKSQSDASYLKGKLTKYAIPRSATFNLLQDETVKRSIKPVSHLKTKFAVTMCTEELNVPHANVPFEMVRHFRINSKRQFLPILVHNMLQTRNKDLVEITADSTEMQFTFVYEPASIGRFKFLIQMEETFRNFMRMGFTEKDVDDVKGVFADTNLYLLCATVFIGGIHLLLDFLSFKNDVSFWKSHTTMAGLSVRTVVWRSFSQTVVFLYLLDEGTSLLVLVPCGIGMVIEFWKLTKVFKIKFSLSGGFSIKRAIDETEAELKTRKYDEESMKYLSYVLYPMVLCAAVYSLVYQPHKSWYSWTINSMVNGVYVFGFLFMLPQLFINYRLKSVAALPWKAFTYRAFNTFIDDIFAFIITMPTAHRLACFRDDIVFLIYLYQRWLYPVDKTRVEDGSGEPAPGEIEEKKAK